MRPVETLLLKSVLLLILCGLDFGFLVGGYGILRVLRISVNWVTWLLGSLLIALSAGVCLAMVMPGLAPWWLGRGANLVGAFSFLIAIYAASQWVTRQWYVQVKRQAGKWLIQASKNTLLFLRKHHLFFGWIVVAGAIGHMAFFLPSLSSIRVSEEITGFLAISILALMVILGMWVWIASRRKLPLPKAVRTLHSALTIAFLIVLFLHV